MRAESLPSFSPQIVRTLLGIGLLMAILALGACETAEGFGRDVEHLGEEIEEKAK